MQCRQAHYMYVYLKEYLILYIFIYNVLFSCSNVIRECYDVDSMSKTNT